MIKIEIQGRPMGKQRPKVNTITRVAYTPQKTVEYERLVRLIFVSKYRGFKPYTGELRAKIYAYYKVPKGTSKKKTKELMEREWCTKKPDADNIAKMVLDALNGMAYIDDNQIAFLEVFKKYGEEEKVILEIEEL